MRGLFFLLIATFALSNEYVVGQNLVTNGDFETCKPNVSCTAGEGHFNQVADWGSFGFGSHLGGYSTPDWYVDINAPDGSHVAGIYENEGIFYDFGSGGLKTSIYRVSFWAKGYDENATLGIDPTHGVSCYISTVPPSQLNCTNFAGGSIYPIGKRILSTSATWTQIEMDFPVYNAVVPYRYLVFGSYRNGECDRYVQIDGVRVEDQCCAEFMKYQHCDYLPQYTSRESFIRAGYNVSCVWQPVGDVVVKSNQNVTFQAGGYVSLEPGFSTEVGAVFTAKIDDCNNVPSGALSDTNLIFYTNAAFFTCNSGLNNAGFASTGFSYYRVRLFDRWGQKVYDMIGHINEIYTLYASGNEISTGNTQGTFTVLLELFNCSYTKTEGFSMFYEYVNPCVPASKTDFISNDIETIKPVLGNASCKIFPNPSSENVNIVFTDGEVFNTSVTMINSIGQRVYNGYFSSPSFSIYTVSFSEGIYYIHLIRSNGENFIQKLMITK